MGLVRQQVRNGIHNRIAHITSGTAERASNYFYFILFLYAERKLSLAYRTYQNIRKIFLHRFIILQ